jgi:hypothetical protein
MLLPRDGARTNFFETGTRPANRKTTSRDDALSSHRESHDIFCIEGYYHRSTNSLFVELGRRARQGPEFFPFWERCQEKRL